MKKIKIKEITEGCVPSSIKKGDWIDLKAAQDIVLSAPHAETLKRRVVADGAEHSRKVNFETALIPLGIAMELPKGYEAVVLPRSSSFMKFGIIFQHSMGVIDNSYCGDEDEWKCPVIALKDVNIRKGDRICQFRIQLSQKASLWQKLKWLISSKITFERVQYLDINNRGGFGSTGIK